MYLISVLKIEITSLRENRKARLYEESKED